MLRTSGSAACPEIQRIVDSLLMSDSNYDRQENRSAHRDHLVRAVEIHPRESDRMVQAFSRNISGSGIGVITDELLNEGIVAVLHIANLNGEDTKILAECRWCKPYGKWFLAGWQFISIKR